MVCHARRSRTEGERQRERVRRHDVISVPDVNAESQRKRKKNKKGGDSPAFSIPSAAPSVCLSVRLYVCLRLSSRRRERAQQSLESFSRSVEKDEKGVRKEGATRGSCRPQWREETGPGSSPCRGPPPPTIFLPTEMRKRRLKSWEENGGRAWRFPSVNHTAVSTGEGLEMGFGDRR